MILPINDFAYPPVREVKQKAAKGKRKNFDKIIEGKIIFSISGFQPE